MAPNLDPDPNPQNNSHPKDVDDQIDKIGGQIKGLKSKLESIEADFIDLLSLFKKLEETPTDSQTNEPHSPE